MHEIPKGGRFFLKYSKSGRFLGFIRDGTGRPVETAPFARRREAQKDTAGNSPAIPASIRPTKAQLSNPDTDYADDKALDKLLAPPTARESLQRLIEAGASPGRIEMHPLVREAYRVAKTYPPTNEMPGYGGSEWRANRPVTLAGRKAKGWDAAQDHLTEWAKAFSTDGPVRYERRATIVIGLGGAGKSTLMEPLARNRHAAIIDADEAEKVLPEFHNGLGASAVHGESSDLMYGPGGPMDRLSAQGANLVIQKIGHNPESIRKLVRGLKERGYDDLSLIHLRVDPAEAFRRRIGRFLRTGRINAKGYRESAANLMNDIDADYASDKATDQTFAQDKAPAAKSVDRLKAAILLGSQMASKEAERMLAMKARQVSSILRQKKPE